MVLGNGYRSRGLRLALGVGVLSCVLLAAACIPKNPVQRLPEETPVAVAFVVDIERGETRSPPEAVKERLYEAFIERNLRPHEVGSDALITGFARTRLTDARFAEVRAASGGAPYTLLGELRVEFYSQLNGRYRWMVYATLTAARAGGTSVSRAFDVPVFLNFAHERESEALAQAADVVADRTGALLDDLLAMPVSSAEREGPDAAGGVPSTMMPDAGVPLTPSGGTIGPVPPASGGGGSGASGGSPRSSAEVKPLPSPAGDAVYFVMVDRFANGNRANDGEVDPKDPAAFHGGDLDGLIGKLDYLHGLGIRTVWLSPVFKMRTEKFFDHGAFHGYWVEDLAQVEPRFGDEAALRRLSDALHARGMRLVLDLVLNHVGPDAPLVTQRPEWFHRKGPIEDWNDPVQLETHDVHGLPDLDTSRDDVYAYLRETSLAWVERVRPDGFRLDAVKHLPLSFWRRFADDTKRRTGRDFWLVAEMLDGDARTVSRAQEKGKFDAMFDFPLHFAMVDVFCRGRSPSRLGAVLSQDRFYDDPRSLVTMLDNHDLPRVMSECGGDVKKVEQALTFQLTARGVPSFTYGFETGLTGEKEPLNRGAMRFDESHPLTKALKKRLEQRRQHPVLERGASRILVADDGLFAYLRLSAEEAALVAVNTDGRARKVALPRELGRMKAVDADSGAAVATASGAVEVPARQVRVLFLSPERARGFAEVAARAESQSRGEAARRVVEVSLKGARKGESARVYLAGSGPEMGDWNPEKAVPLMPKRVKKLTLPVGSVLEYKLLVRGAGKAQAKWEEGGNRVLFVDEGDGPLKVELQWRDETSLTAKGERR